jgi:hypothetical protein
LAGEKDVLLGINLSASGKIQERVNVFVYEYKGQSYPLQSKKIRNPKEPDKPTALVHPKKPKRAILRGNFI